MAALWQAWPPAADHRMWARTTFRDRSWLQAQGVVASRIELLSDRSLLHLDVDVLEDLVDLLLGGVLAGPRWRSVPRRGGIDLDEAAGAVGLADWVEGADVVLERLLSM
jgi:hypothetical protein